MILIKHNIIFQHVQKTGGTTLHKLFQFSPNIGTLLKPCGMHFRMTDLLQFSEFDFNEYETITIKRNPWDRLASFHIDSVRHYDLEIVPNVPVPWFNYFAGLKEFDDMVDKLFVDGEIVPNLTMFDFDDLQNQVCPWWRDRFGYDLWGLPRLNTKPEQKYIDLRMEMVNDERFDEQVRRLCHREIDYFDWERPVY